MEEITAVELAGFSELLTHEENIIKNTNAMHRPVRTRRSKKCARIWPSAIRSIMMRFSAN
mgnify:CR=1 FL=1